MKPSGERKKEERRGIPDVIAVDDTGATTIVIKNVNNATGIRVYWSQAGQEPSEWSDDVIPVSDFNEDLSIPFADDGVDGDVSVVRIERALTLRSPKYKRKCVMRRCHNDVHTECAVYNPLLCHEHLITSARCDVYGLQPDHPAETAKPASTIHTSNGQVKRIKHVIGWCKDNRLVNNIRARLY